MGLIWAIRTHSGTHLTHIRPKLCLFINFMGVLDPGTHPNGSGAKFCSGMMPSDIKKVNFEAKSVQKLASGTRYQIRYQSSTMPAWSSNNMPACSSNNMPAWSSNNNRPPSAAGGGFAAAVVVAGPGRHVVAGAGRHVVAGPGRHVVAGPFGDEFGMSWG